MRVATTTAPGAEQDAAPHEARKAAKRLRYVLEIIEPSAGTKARRLRKRVKAVQSALGDHYYTVAARPSSASSAPRHSSTEENGFTFGILHAAEQADAGRLYGEFQKAWKKVGSTNGF